MNSIFSIISVTSRFLLICTPQRSLLLNKALQPSTSKHGIYLSDNLATIHNSIQDILSLSCKIEDEQDERDSKNVVEYTCQWIPLQRPSCGVWICHRESFHSFSGRQFWATLPWVISAYKRGFRLICKYILFIFTNSILFRWCLPKSCEPYQTLQLLGEPKFPSSQIRQFSAVTSTNFFFLPWQCHVMILCPMDANHCATVRLSAISKCTIASF